METIFNENGRETDRKRLKAIAETLVNSGFESDWSIGFKLACNVLGYKVGFEVENGIVNVDITDISKTDISKLSQEEE